MTRLNFTIVSRTSDCLVIKDIGPWDVYPTVTNQAETVVKQLAPGLDGRRLEYIDSEGQQDELLVKDGEFAGFAPGRA